MEVERRRRLAGPVPAGVQLEGALQAAEDFLQAVRPALVGR